MPAPERPARGSLGVAPLLEESVDDLYENAPCGYLSTLLDGTIVRVNRTFLTWTGYGRDDLVDRVRVHDILAPGDRIFYETHYAPLLQMQGTVREIAVEILRADGTQMPALINSVLRRNESDEPALVRTTIFDATDRRRYERELLRARREAETRARAAAALAHVNDGVLVVDPAGRISLANAAAAAILALDDAAQGRPVADAVPGWDELAARAPVGTLESQPTPATLPLPRAGRDRWLSIAGVDSGEGIVYTIRDVTADRRLDEMRDDLIGIVSHELRTPLTGVTGAAQTLLAHELPAEQRSQLLAVIAGQAERLGRILDEILLSRQLESGEVELASRAFDLAELAAATAAEVSAALDAGPRVHVAAPHPVVVAGDPAYTRQALANLVENALKYSPAGTPVAVRVDEARGRGRASVADEGPGIPPAQRERVFERFHRLDPELARDAGGVGLGLYVARELVRSMDGRVGLEATGPGSTFFLELPLAGEGA